MAGLTAPALALEFDSTDKAIKYRQSAFALMGAHLTDLGAVVKDEKDYVAAEVKANADVILAVANLPWQAFGKGTEGGKAKPEIWSDRAKFDKTAKEFQVAAAELQKVAATGKPELLKKAFGETAKSCKTCHDSFRSK